jgi:hypothetical protein
MEERRRCILCGSDPDPIRIRIRIHRIHMFLGLPDPDPSTVSASKNSKKTLDSYCFVTFFGLLSLKKDVNVPSKVISRKTFFKFIFCWHLEAQ